MPAGHRLVFAVPTIMALFISHHLCCLAPLTQLLALHLASAPLLPGHAEPRAGILCLA